MTHKRARSAGCDGTAKDMAHFIQTAIGSSNELDYWIHLSRRLKYLEPMIASKLAAQTNAVRRMLIRLLKRLRGA